jgi:hypothetical protein
MDKVIELHSTSKSDVGLLSSFKVNLCSSKEQDSTYLHHENPQLISYEFLMNFKDTIIKKRI